MFEGAKALIQGAIDRNDALIAIDQTNEDPPAPNWARPRSLRRVLAVAFALGIVMTPLVTASADLGWTAGYLVALLLVLALARSAARAAPASFIKATHLVVVVSLAALAVLVALGAQADINLQAGASATAGILVAVLLGAVATPTLVRMWGEADATS